MTTRTTYAALFALLLTVLGFADIARAKPAAHCYGDWSAAARLVHENKIVDVARLEKLARGKVDGRIITTKLCKVDDRYVYHVVVRGSDGRMRRLTVDAKRPFR